MTSKQFLTLALVTLGFSGCKDLNQLQHNPPIRPDEWCQNQPCSAFGNFIISQPSSSIIVYILALFTLWIAYYFYKTRANQKSRYWWSVSLLLGGLGAATAGTSFQAFGYMIKCEGRAICTFTSWWEIVYNILTVAGAGTLLIAVSYSCMSTIGQKRSRFFAAFSTLVYSIACLWGCFLPNAFLVSFEFMIMATSPAYLTIVGLHFHQYWKTPSTLLKRFLACWGLLALTFGTYYLYAIGGYTQQLWAQNIWFSENDVLHVMMLIWCAYIYLGLASYIEDQSDI